MAKLSVCITTQNEGGRVRSTAEAFLSAYPDVEIVVGADGVTDGCCDNLPEGVVVVRNESRIGCGRTKCRIVEAATGDALMFIDAHQNVLEGDLVDLVETAMQDNVIAQPLIGSITYDKKWNSKRHTITNYIPNNVGLTPKPRHYLPTERRDRFNTRLVGVGLLMSRETYNKVGGWNQYKGFYGSQERGMSLRALATDTPIVVCGDVIVGHEFGGRGNPSRMSFPYNAVYKDKPIHNLSHAYYVVSTDEEWRRYFLPVLDKGARRIENDVLAREDRERFQALRTVESSRFIRKVEDSWRQIASCPDQGGATLEPSAVRIIAGSCRGRVLELGTGSGKGTKAALLLGDEVVTVDHMKKFVQMTTRKLGSNPKLTVLHAVIKGRTYALPSDIGTFDTIVVDGPPGRVAREATLARIIPLLNDGGRILIDDTKRDKKIIMQWAEQHSLKIEMLKTRRGMAIVTRKKV